MKLATYNLNGIRARLPRLVEWLQREQPDVVCLQELKCADESLPVADIEATGYGAVWHGQKGFNGVAILAKGAVPELVRVGLPGDPDDSHSRYIEAVAHGFIVGSIYLPNGNPVGTEKFAYKLKWMERLAEHAVELLRAERPTVLAGDYNVIPTDFDVFSVRAMQHDALMQPESRAAFRTLVHQGWTDALRALHSGEPMYTFWDYTAGAWQRDAGFRIDHLLCDPLAADRLRGAGVDRWARGEEKASDHAPTWIELA
ncbi:MAG TPA: exodeoxyribonuclease III [Sphingomicrobium sp.]|nr:exodeoxyribonuclease III [Sphingomicrobium sp.]